MNIELLAVSLYYLEVILNNLVFKSYLFKVKGLILDC